jgi:dihydroneopterin aldolase
MRIPSQLLEHVAWRIAQRLLDDFQTISEINIALYKQNPPMGADCSQVGVEATYIR